MCCATQRPRQLRTLVLGADDRDARNDLAQEPIKERVGSRIDRDAPC